MAQRAPRPDADLLAELAALPATVKGEIIDGQLHVQPRPRFRHGRVSTFLGRHIGGAFDFDEGGPGGWWIVIEPGIELPGAPEISPDVAGWRRTTMPEPPPEGEPLRAVPDWVCEVLSTSNARYDQTVKFPFYARVGVPWLWVIDSRARTLEIRKLEAGRWSRGAVHGDEDTIRADPFSDIEIPIARMWV